MTAELRIGSPARWVHPSFYPVQALVSELAGLGIQEVPISAHMARLSNSLGQIRLPSFSRRSKTSLVFIPMMGPRFDLLAAGSRLGRPVVYAWDIWEKDVAKWIENVDRFGVELLICTSSDAKALLDSGGVGCRTFYLPEATDVSLYQGGGPLVERTTSVLEIGRRSDFWHSAVVEGLARRGCQHLFEVSAGSLVFETRSQMLEGFKSSAVSLCLPRSMTHGDSSGKVETFTHRYLESMAAGCIVLGHAPRDLVDLFGYNPVVEVDWQDPLGQIFMLLDSLPSLQSLVDTNVIETEMRGSWRVRSKEILALVRAEFDLEVDDE
ncbi:hypothetical protein ACN9MI_21165 [Rhodococcoides fascians]|uniref:hypothetical protein n=1 Tax=Rhodococcoides fascians TaxID=1828 RepID=UPI003CF6E391